MRGEGREGKRDRWKERGRERGREVREGGREQEREGRKEHKDREKAGQAPHYPMHMTLTHKLPNTHLLESLFLLHSSFGGEPVVDVQGQLWNPQQLH